jgi:hypothetical protein
VVLLGATIVAAAFILPARAAGKSTHVVLRSSVSALRAPKGIAPRHQTHVDVAWTAAAPIPVPVGEPGGGAASGTKFYVIGGYDNSGVVVNNNQLYNKTSNTWTAKAVIPGNGGGWADAAFCYNSADKTIHVVNGVDGAFLYAAHQVYNTVTDTWSNLALPNTPADGNFYSQDSGCAFIGGKLYLFGGYGLTDAQGVGQLEKLTWVYDPTTDTWSDTTKLMNVGRIWQGYTNNTTTAFVAAGIIDINTFASTAATERFTPAGGWVATANLPKALAGPGEGVIKTHLMVFGGFDSSFIAQNTTYHCVQPTCSAWSTTTFNLPAATGFAAWGAGSAVYNATGYDSSFTTLANAEHLP